MADESSSEGRSKAPYRHALGWQDESFWNQDALYREMERQFDICHTCRRCFSLCESFPTLFDLIDDSQTMELDSVPREVYWKVVDQCYLCDLCFMTKCPYTPPHEFEMDFPHLMLRAKAVRYRSDGARLRDRFLTATDAVGRLAGVPVVAGVVNAANRSAPLRVAVEKSIGIHRKAKLPEFESRSARRRLARHEPLAVSVQSTAHTRGRVAIFTTCYGNRNMPQVVEDLVAVLEHNGIPVRLVSEERCCAMPKMELGDLEAVERLKNHNVPRLARLVDDGWDIIAPVSSCALMFRQELPAMFPGDVAVDKVKAAFFDPFEYLALRHDAGLLSIDFKESLGKVLCHTSCHQRVQNFGPKTRDVLELIPDTEVELVQRCSGHDGTYAVRRETYENAMKIGRPVFRRVVEAAPDYYGSDCPLAGEQLEHGAGAEAGPATHPISMLRAAYAI